MSILDKLADMTPSPGDSANIYVHPDTWLSWLRKYGSKQCDPTGMRELIQMGVVGTFFPVVYAEGELKGDPDYTRVIRVVTNTNVPPGEVWQHDPDKDLTFYNEEIPANIIVAKYVDVND